jgi:hypothetical protein
MLHTFSRLKGALECGSLLPLYGGASLLAPDELKQRSD